MSKQIKISDELYNTLQDQATSNFRSMGGQLEYLLSLDNVPEKNNKKILEVSKVVEDSNPITHELFNSLSPEKTLLANINLLEVEVDGADETNQDPDYWDIINAKKNNVKELWAQWHQLTGK